MLVKKIDTRGTADTCELALTASAKALAKSLIPSPEPRLMKASALDASPRRLTTLDKR